MQTRLTTIQEVKQYIPTELENSNVSYVNNRFTKMETQRSAVDKNWIIYKKMIDAEYTTYWDERSSSVVPLAVALIELYKAEAKKMETEYTIKWEWKSKDRAKALDYAWKHDFRKNKRKQAFSENEDICAWFWTSILYTWVDTYYWKQHDPISLWNWQYDWEEKEINETKILVQNFDIRYFYIDERANSIEEANDCIAIQYMSIEKFYTMTESNPIYKNTSAVWEIW